MDKLKLLKLAEKEDSESLKEWEMEEQKADTAYLDFYNDVKQPKKYIKEDW